MAVTLIQLIQSKDYSEEFKYRLLRIAGSYTWIEDLMDFIKELDSEPETPQRQSIATVGGIEIPVD